MCTVSVKVDEAVLREILPELDSTAAIRQWVQQLIDLRIQEIVAEDDINRDMTPEELYHVIEQDIKAIYAHRW